MKCKLPISLENRFCQMTFCWRIQVRGGLAKADRGKNVFLRQTQVTGRFVITYLGKDKG